MADNILLTGYTDTCKYTEHNGNEVVKCGDKCISKYNETCECGSDYETYTYSKIDLDDYCCLPLGESCTMVTDEGYVGKTRYPPYDRLRAVCSQGRRLSKSTPCNTEMGLQCYNSYEHSLNIGPKSHYTCPNTCVPWEDMCQGFSQCEGDHKVCGPDLRCPRLFIRDTNEKKIPP